LQEGQTGRIAPALHAVGAVSCAGFACCNGMGLQRRTVALIVVVAVAVPVAVHAAGTGPRTPSGITTKRICKRVHGKRTCTLAFPRGIRLRGHQVMELSGRAVVADTIDVGGSAKLILRHADVRMTRAFGTAPEIHTRGRGQMVVDRSKLDGPLPQWFGHDGAAVDVRRSDVEAEIQMADRSRLRVDRSVVATSQPGDQARVEISRSYTSNVKMILTPGDWSFENLRSIPSTAKRGMTLAYSRPGGWSLRLRDVRVDNWIINPVEGTNLTLTNVESAALEPMLSEFKGAIDSLPEGRGITQDLSIGAINVSLRNVNLLGYPWHLILDGSADVTISNSHVTETIVSGDAVLRLTGCKVDAWFLLAYDNGRIEVTRSEVNHAPTSYIGTSGGGTVRVADSRISGVGASLDGGRLQVTNSPDLPYVRARNSASAAITASGPVPAVTADSSSTVEVDGQRR
jgi:hypothetical protein